MSIKGTLAQPQEVTVGGKKVKLHPMSLYELGLCETAFIAYMTRQAILTTRGLGTEEREQALNRAAVYCSALEVDLTPLNDWINGTLEGLCSALASCMVTHDGEPVSPRDAGRWCEETGSTSDGTPTKQWMIDSRLCADPTDPESTPEMTTRGPKEEEPSESLTEPSSTGG